MRDFFVLSKREQRVVIVIVLALVAGAFAKYQWDARSQPRPAKPKVITATAPPASARDESEPADETQ